jgi:hypothetical protein
VGGTRRPRRARVGRPVRGGVGRPGGSAGWAGRSAPVLAVRPGLTDAGPLCRPLGRDLIACRRVGHRDRVAGSCFFPLRVRTKKGQENGSARRKSFLLTPFAFFPVGRRPKTVRKTLLTRLDPFS